MTYPVIGRVLFASTVSLLALSVQPQNLPKNSEVTSTGKFKIASSLSYAPFEFVDEAGAPAGLDIDLAKAAAKVLGAELEIIKIPFSAQLPALASGRVKVAWSSFTVTSERLKQVDFVTFMKSGTVIVTSKEKGYRLKTKADLCGAALAVGQGSAQDFAADKLNAECIALGKSAIKKAIYPEQKDSIQAVIAERVDGRFEDATSGGYYVSKSGGKMVVAGEEYFPLPLGVAVAKGDEASAEMMRAVLQKLMDDGTYKAIVEKYGMSHGAVPMSSIITTADQLQKQ